LPRHTLTRETKKNQQGMVALGNGLGRKLGAPAESRATRNLVHCLRDFPLDFAAVRS